ncbi:cell envelope integrity EipB family protein [uncultured Bartonella sp.]|uniref:cell envelope integrity EipB family protein n=1 Tax=uncultured Bartonella sp. TaxID=104108 RepID=UPI0025DA2CED|nr:cell envelope integrity EipB family protein [uncultured Bartonella sp.]
MPKFLLAIILSFMGLGIAQAEDKILMVPHLAIYDLQLENASDKSGITGLVGRMAYEFNGSSCEGYTTRFRFVTRINMADSPARLTDQQMTSFEAANGKEFRFVSKTIIDQDVTSETDGVAKIANGNMTVSLKKPKETEVKLKSAAFPTIQTEEVIRQAKAGRHFYRTVLFDGSDDADRLTEATVVVGDKVEAKPDNETKMMGKLGKEPYWPVTISYFNDDENQDGLPVYRTSFFLYENGVTRDLVMDYGNFSVRGKLQTFKLFDIPTQKDGCKD